MAEKKSAVTQMTKDAPVQQALETAPVIHVDGAVGFALSDGFVRMNLFQDRLAIDPPKVGDQEFVMRVVCARLVLSVTTARRIHKWLGDAISGIDADAAKASKAENDAGE